MGRKRVVFYTENYAYGGLERFLFDAISTLPAEWDVSVLHNDYPGFAERLAANVKRPLQRLTVPIATKPLFTDYWSRFLPRLAVKAAARAAGTALARRHFEINRVEIGRALKNIGPADVMHIVSGGYPGGESGAAAARAAAEHGIPRRLMSILSLHDPAYTRAPEAAVERRLLADVDLLVANCEASRQALLHHRGFPADKVVTVHTGIPAPRPDAVNARKLRALWIRDGKILIGCLGALYPLKGHQFFLEAAPAVLARVPHARFVLVGDGESAAELKALARTLNIGHAVSFPGYYDGDSADALAAFDILAHPTSQREGLPYAILEAMAMAKPIVATAVGGVPEAVEDGVTGLLVPPASSAALADALLKLTVDADLARRLGETAQRRQRELFSLERATAGMQALYENASPVSR